LLCGVYCENKLKTSSNSLLQKVLSLSDVQFLHYSPPYIKALYIVLEEALRLDPL
jgi:hypothetical protein